jgi:hypothetical protein
MKITITALKAPWPEGSQVGSVVELEGDKLPAWAVGKCTRVPDGFVAAPAADVSALQAENAALRAMLEAKPADEATATSRRSR